MEVIEVHPTADQYAYTFGGAAPLATVRPGRALRLWSEDAFGGTLRTTADTTSTAPAAPGLNPQTGPFLVEGAEPGDVLALHLVSLEPARDWGVSSLVPFFGGLTGTDTTALLTPALPERTWVYALDRARGTLAVELTSGAFTAELPLEPMLGTVGVAPAAGEVRTSLVPGVFGGNLDTPQMKAGTTCYLRVNVPGALFSLGDGHYRQGEGETCGTAVEGAMTTTVVVDLVKAGELAARSGRSGRGVPGALATSAPATPRLEDDDHWMTVGTGRPLEDAWRAGQVEMVRWLRELFGLDGLDAYQLLSQVGLAPLANVVDPAYAALSKVPKALLPRVGGSAGAFGGAHARLREAARGLA